VSVQADEIGYVVHVMEHLGAGVRQRGGIGERVSGIT